MYWEDRFLSDKEQSILDAQQQFNELSSITEYALEKQLSQIQSFYHMPILTA